MNEYAIYNACRLYYDAMHISLMLDQYEASDKFLDCIYDTLRGKYDPEMHASAQTIAALNVMDYGETVAEAEEDLEANERMTAFGEWLTNQQHTHCWPLDIFIATAQRTVRYIDQHPSENVDDMCDFINTVFGDCELNDDMVTFVVFGDITNWLFKTKEEA